VPEKENNSTRGRGALDILLVEYQCAHMNRDHYDSVRWTIGSIFIIASLTAFGASLVESVTQTQVLLLCFASGFLYGVWLLYNWHIEPYVKMSLARLQGIERELIKTFNCVSLLSNDELELFERHRSKPQKYRLINSIPRLHAIIQEVAPPGRGRRNLVIFTGALIIAWSVRMLLLFPTLNLTVHGIIITLECAITFTIGVLLGDPPPR